MGQHAIKIRRYIGIQRLIGNIFYPMRKAHTFFIIDKHAYAGIKILTLDNVIRRIRRKHRITFDILFKRQFPCRCNRNWEIAILLFSAHIKAQIGIFSLRKIQHHIKGAFLNFNIARRVCPKGQTIIGIWIAAIPHFSLAAQNFIFIQKIAITRQRIAFFCLRRRR